MKSSRIITILAGLVVAMTASAQVGILDQNAEFRKIPMGAQRDSAKLDSLNRYYTERPVAGTRRDGDKPLLFLIGDSTMRTGVEGNGDNGQWGWGYYIQNYFDTSRIDIIIRIEFALNRSK